jgi:hypothetical protein
VFRLGCADTEDAAEIDTTASTAADAATFEPQRDQDMRIMTNPFQ